MLTVVAVAAILTILGNMTILLVLALKGTKFDIAVTHNHTVNQPEIASTPVPTQPEEDEQTAFIRETTQAIQMFLVDEDQIDRPEAINNG